MIDAIVAGHLCLDIIPQFTRAAGKDMAAYISPGRLSEVGPAALSTGGAVSNTGINLHRLGIRVRLMGKIGDDLFGQAILDIVRGYGAGLAEGMLVVPGEVSSYTLVLNPPGIDRAFLHCPGANETFSAGDVRYDLLSEARLFHLGYPPLLRHMYADEGRELEEIYEQAKALGATTSLDMTMPEVAGQSGQADWDLILQRTLPHVDLFLPSIEEALYMLDRTTFERLDRQMGAGHVLDAVDIAMMRGLAGKALGYGAKLVVLKMGTRGIYMRTAETLPAMGRGAPDDLNSWRGRELWAPPYVPRQIASTVGAGDAAIAGLLAAWLRATPPELALNVAAAAGASCVEEAGSLLGVRPWEETLGRIQGGWPRSPSSAPPAGWYHDETAGLWRGPADRS